MMAVLRRPSAPRCGCILLCGLLLAMCLPAAGCVRRRMTIRSNPSGAVAFVDDRRIGVTPVSTAFTYYGTRKIQLFKDGFESLTVKQRFLPPWYQFPPLDFLTENLWPGEIRDERVVEFELVPQQIVPAGELVGRAEGLRNSARQGHLTPLPQGPAAVTLHGATPAPAAP